MKLLLSDATETLETDVAKGVALDCIITMLKLTLGFDVEDVQIIIERFDDQFTNVNEVLAHHLNEGQRELLRLQIALLAEMAPAISEELKGV